MSGKFIVGKNYFQLLFLDNQQCFPTIKSMVYLGKNIERNDKNMGKEKKLVDFYRNYWYFQDTRSYIESGEYDGILGEYHKHFPTDHLNIDMVSDVTLYDESMLYLILTTEELIKSLQNWNKIKEEQSKV